MNLVPPSFSEYPYKKIKLPEELYSKIMKEYSMMSFDEFCGSTGYNDAWDAHTSSGISIVGSENPHCYFSQLLDHLYEECYDLITPYVEEWSGCKVERTFFYGIRSYVRNSILHLHRDRYQTHVLSCIVFVDQKSEENWPLDFFDHQHKHHQIFFEPGEMLLYESLCAHGRLTPFKGDYYRNMYFHWKPENWDLECEKYSSIRYFYKNVDEYLKFYE